LNHVRIGGPGDSAFDKARHVFFVSGEALVARLACSDRGKIVRIRHIKQNL
jgi:hypothetical protein